jgi:hypothetical protein
VAVALLAALAVAVAVAVAAAALVVTVAVAMAMLGCRHTLRSTRDRVIGEVLTFVVVGPGRNAAFIEYL